MPTYHKPIYVEQFGFTGRPDLAALYGMSTMHSVNRAYGGVEYWTDATALPSSSLWYDTVATGVTLNGWTIVYVDHESWLVSTQAQRLATATKVATVYSELKSRLPNVTIGFYGAQFTPVRDVSATARCLGAHDSAGYLAWQAENVDFAAVYAAVDMIMPSLYFFETRVVEGVTAVSTFHQFFYENLMEVRRLRSLYGHGQPIYTWAWNVRHDETTVLDTDVWEDMVRTSYQLGDGVIFFTISPTAWDETANWWVSMKIEFARQAPWGDRTLTVARTARS